MALWWDIGLSHKLYGYADVLVKKWLKVNIMALKIWFHYKKCDDIWCFQNTKYLKLTWELHFVEQYNWKDG